MGTTKHDTPPFPFPGLSRLGQLLRKMLRGVSSQTFFLFVELYDFFHVRILHVVTSVYTRQGIALSDSALSDSAILSFAGLCALPMPLARCGGRSRW